MTTIQELLIETWVEYGISTVLVGMRLFTRTKMVGGRLQWDDYLMILAWVRSPALSVGAMLTLARLSSP